MPSTIRRLDRGRATARRTAIEVGRELRDARIAAGLSQRALAWNCRMSASHISKLERALVKDPSLDDLCVVFSVLGHRFSCRAFPEGPPMRDASHVRLLEGFRRQLHPSVRMETEVPLHRPDDPRAWDTRLLFTVGECRVEGETAVRDTQATDRRIAGKMRDDKVDTVILLVADTVHNRRVLRENRELLRARFPLDTREIMACLRAGTCPPASGIVILRREGRSR